MGCVCSKVREQTNSPKENRLIPRGNSSLSADSKEALTGPKARQNGHATSVLGAEEASDRRNDRLFKIEPAALPSPVRAMPSKAAESEQVAAGWPTWLAAVANEAIKGWIPRRADSFEKLDKIGQGTYSNVYKARDLETGKLVALKKVRFDNLEPESVRFMAREIEVLRRLDHPNIVKLEGLVTSRMSCSLYLVFEYMEHDLAGLAASPRVVFTEAQVKCYMQQLLRGLEHCHARGVLHRDIKGSNLLLDNQGVLKIADFGLATFYRPEQNVPLTSRVVTLWYRPPELLLGATNYGVAVDLWSSGCILAELLAGKPIMPGRTEVEQLHKIFKLCGSPSEEYWRKSRLPHATIFKPTQPYKRSLLDTFKEFPSSSLALVDTLLSIEPGDRGTAASALSSEFFTSKPLPCDPSSLPQYPPSKEYDAKLRDEEARRQRAAGQRAGRVAESSKRSMNGHRPSRAVPAPHANAELVESIALQKKQMSQQNMHGPKSMSEKFSGSEPAGGSFAPTHTMAAAPPAPSEKRSNSPVPPLPARPLPGRLPLSSKSGPQPSQPKITGAVSVSAWGPAKAAVGTAELPDVRMAPPRAPNRPTKSVTVPDFALQGGYPESRSRAPSDGNLGAHFSNGVMSDSRDSSWDHYVPSSAKKIRERSGESHSEAARRDRSVSEPSQTSSSSSRTQTSAGAESAYRGPAAGGDAEGDMVATPVNWRRQSHSGPLQIPRKLGGALSLEKRHYEHKVRIGPSASLPADRSSTSRDDGQMTLPKPISSIDINGFVGGLGAPIIPKRKFLPRVSDGLAAGSQANGD